MWWTQFSNVFYMSNLIVNIISIDIKNLDVSMYELGLTDSLDLCYVGPT